MTTPRERLANYIERGNGGGQYGDWSLTITFPDRYEPDDKIEVFKAIARLVRQGILEGISPPWKVWVDPSIDLDAEIHDSRP